VLVSTVESADLAFCANFAEAVPEATNGRDRRGDHAPRPVETALSEAGELVDLCDQRVREFLRAVVGEAGADGARGWV